MKNVIGLTVCIGIIILCVGFGCPNTEALLKDCLNSFKQSVMEAKMIQKPDIYSPCIKCKKIYNHKYMIGIDDNGKRWVCDDCWREAEDTIRDEYTLINKNTGEWVAEEFSGERRKRTVAMFDKYKDS